MNSDIATNVAASESSTNRVVRRLAWRYLFVLAAVAGLMVVDQAIIQPILIEVNAFAPAINVAGRQRMLSQRLTKAALVMREADDEASRSRRRDELANSLRQWITEHDALLRGDQTLGISPIRSPELDEAWATLEPHHRAMVAAAGELVHATPDAGSSRVSAAAVAALVEHESQFLPTMDRIVKLMEDEAAKAVYRLRAASLVIASTIVALLVGIGWFVVRPATRTIRSQVDQLESRVAERTRELSSALESLRREVVERQSVEQKNQRLSAELTHAGRVTTLGHLTAGLAHELNQPLAAISNYTEACDVLLNELPQRSELGRLREFIDQARRAALRAGQIVRRMRNFVRPNGAVIIEVDLNALVHEIVDLCHYESDSHGAKILLDLHATDDVVSADPIQIQQVLVNLVQNSLQAMRGSDGRPRQLVIRTMNCGEFAQVDVFDTGPGFASMDPDIVFAPFHTTKLDGLGIGLSICRSIVENHGGKIWTESRPRRGAQVSFTLPLAAKHATSFQSQPDSLCC